MSDSLHRYQFHVAMSCSGCSGAIQRVLDKLDGVETVDISLETQSVEVLAQETLGYKTVLEAIKKTGKHVSSAEADGVAQAVEPV